MIPLYQTITLLKKSKVSDGWGGKIEEKPTVLRCRIVEGTRALKNVSTEEDVRNVRNREVVSVAKIWLGGLVSVSLEDTLSFKNELGEIRLFIPISVEVLRGVSGEPLYTVVNVGNK